VGDTGENIVFPKERAHSLRLRHRTCGGGSLRIGSKLHDLIGINQGTFSICFGSTLDDWAIRLQL
jgi:hypothetical protein